MRSEQEVNSAMDRYADMVLRLCTVHLKNGTDAEDIFQTVFLKYALHGKPFESAEHEKAWMIRVTVNACRDLLKSFFRSRTITVEDFSGYAPAATAEQYAVMEAVWSLPKQYRDVIYLHYYEGYTAPEIAGILQRNPNTVYTHLRKGRELLREILGGVMDERILLSHSLEPYLEQGSTITIKVAGGDETHGEEMLSRVLCRAYNIAARENVVYYQVDWETVRAAQAAGLCIPWYLAWQQLLQEDPAVTAEDVRQLPKEEIHQMVQMAVTAVAGVTLFLVFTSLIGVCVNADMHCNVTRLWGMGAAAVTVAGSLINLLSGKEGQVPG